MHPHLFPAPCSYSDPFVTREGVIVPRPTPLPAPHPQVETWRGGETNPKDGAY